MNANRNTIHSRSVQGPQDFWKIRELLLSTVPTTPLGLNWDVRRWDGAYFYNPSGAWSPDWAGRVWLWETGAGQLVGVLNADGPDEAYLQVDPDFRHLEPEMIAWAEEHLAAPAQAGSARQLEFYVYEYDALRQRLLAERGYEKQTYGGMLRHMRLGQGPIPDQPIAAGYTLRTTHPEELADCQRIAALLNAAFRRDFHNAAEYQMFARFAPCFYPELDLVAEAPDGSLAAYVGVPYHAAHRLGIFEPVCTHPKHQRKGLGRSLMLEGLRRLRAIGATDVTVDTGDMIPANCLYDSMGFTEAYKGYSWRKRWVQECDDFDNLVK